ncbi:DUF1714-domain-containing protein [Ascodesmis nigricans]|uniref:histone acetyltransferase n=1 Tax=Ascodesmis nigricans TaxID=341454 RepID=A0A4S2N733_9PEZI|nr:DUF1714-domain-containing protein [Ascodesmis nigricans]
MPSTFQDRLSQCLPIDLEVTVYELASSPAKCAPLFLPPPPESPHPTTREARFLAIEHDSVLIFAMEVWIYKDSTTGDVTMFVSKVDSSGYFPQKLSSFTPKTEPATKKSVFRTIASAFLDYVIDGQLEVVPKPCVTLALFARSQTQYLFSNSAANSSKHVLSDRALIAWWCQTVNPTFQRYAKSSSAKAYLLVPGSDRLEVQKLLPKATGDEANWIHGHPFELDQARDITVREVIPHFTDDPKSRFMEELNGEDVEKSAKSAKRTQKWNAITTVDQFWELMSYRQECSAGRCVGFLWVTIPGDEVAENEGEVIPTVVQEGKVDSNDEERSPSQEQQTTPEKTSPRPKLVSRKRSMSNVNSLLSPRKKSRTFVSILSRRSSDAHDFLIVDDKRYKRAFESLLLHSDFGNLEKARKSSRKWIDGAHAMAHGPENDGEETQHWGIKVKGKLEVGAPASTHSSPTEKALAEDKPQVNMLGAGLIRKKKKPA